MQPIQFFAARAEDGALVPGATVDVFVTGTQTRAALFADSMGTVPLINPMLADKNARVFFYSAITRIDIQIHRGAYVGPLMRDVVVTDPDDVLTLTNGLYRTVAQGLSETVNGQIFQVISPEDEAAYAIYENVAGTAVDTGKRVPARYLLDKVAAEAQLNADAARAYAEGAQAYAGRNFGPLPSDPSTNPLGDPLVAGDRYFNTSYGIERVFNGSTWYTPNADGQAIQTALANPSDSDQGVGMVAYKRSAISNSPSSLSRWLDGDSVNLWELVDLVTVRPTSDPSTWDWLPALNKWVDNVKNIPNYSRSLRIPRIAGGYSVSGTWLVPLSNIQIRQEADIRLTSTVRQTTVLFAADGSKAPASTLFGINYIVSRGVKVDGNGAAMTFNYAHGDGSDDDSAVRFNRVDTFTATGGHATNGPIDSFSVRQCRNWLVEDFEFSYSKEDNGFSATTDWTTYVRGDWGTYGFGNVVNSRAHHNQDFGITFFNCSGCYGINCRSWRNRGAYSYEDSFTAPRIKYFDGGFIGCHGYMCPEQGFYMQASGTFVDDGCRTYKIIGYVGDNSNGIYENGVVVSGADDVYVGGKHQYNGRSGVAIFNGWGSPMNITVAGEYTNNNGVGVRARGISRLRIKPGTLVKLNGNTLIGGFYSAGIDVSNSGGAPYLQGAGALIAIGVHVENNGVSGIISDYVSSVTIDLTAGADNCQSGSGSGIVVRNANTLFARENIMRSSGANQLFGLVIESTVLVTHDWGNRAPGSVSGEVANNSPSRKGIDRDPAISVGAFTPTGAYPAEGGWSTAALGNALSTLVDSLQRSGILNKN